MWPLPEEGVIAKTGQELLARYSYCHRNCMQTRCKKNNTFYTIGWPKTSLVSSMSLKSQGWDFKNTDHFWSNFR